MHFKRPCYGRMKPSLKPGGTNTMHDVNKEHLPKLALLCGFCSPFYLELEPFRWSRGYDTGLAVHPDPEALFQ